MKNTTLLFFIFLIIILIGGFVVVKGKNGTGASVGVEVPQKIQGPVQQVVLGMEKFNYSPNTVKVKANQPVEVTLDESVKGCLRSFAIRDLGISQYAKTPADKIVFTPTTPGTFSFSCSMGMGYGTLVVQ